ncbi:MAG: type II toxin-antitoxin system VapC family toxin [Candidatus Levybacteria bacterium]|nr:type II toxin-antitoxin system VapC family toxin [Candidatus Levybacteria bacterium]
MNNTTLILDSSVIAKWFFPENDSEKVLKIKESFTNNTVSVVIPVLLYYEINNLLKTAIKMFRINENDAIKVYKAFLKLNFVSYSSELLLEKTLETAVRFDISSYDASYVALAEYLQVTFLTADQRLLQRVSSKFVIDLKEYT